MKICIVSNLYKPHSIGGAERVAESMAECLKNIGHDVFVITAKSKRGFIIENQNGLRIYRFCPLNICHYLNLNKHHIAFRVVWHFLNMFNAHSSLIIKTILRAEKPDVVITHNLMGIGFTAPAVIKRLKIKHIHILHDVQLATVGIIMKGKEKSFLADGFLTKIYRLLCCQLFGSPLAVVSPSKWLMEFYGARRFFKNSKKIILQNPLTNPFDNNIRAKSSPTGRFLCVNQLEKHKGIAWLIELWQKNKIQNELLICGNGSLANNKEMFAELPLNIKIINKLPADELKKIFIDYDFFIMPSLCYENSPTVIPLAHQNALPALVSDIGGSAELVDDGKTGFIFAAGDDQSFLTALNRARNISAEDYERMSKACIEKARSYDVEKYCREILKMIL